MTLSSEARHDLDSMPYTPPEVILRHVGPLWQEYLAAEKRIAELTAATNQLATAFGRRHATGSDPGACQHGHATAHVLIGEDCPGPATRR